MFGPAALHNFPFFRRLSGHWPGGKVGSGLPGHVSVRKGAIVGWFVGNSVGATVGIFVGVDVGRDVGDAVGGKVSPGTIFIKGGRGGVSMKGIEGYHTNSFWLWK